MRFYTIKAQMSNEGTETRDMRGFDTLDKAMVQFHSSMGANIGKCKSITMLVINSEGGIHMNEVWNAAELADAE